MSNFLLFFDSSQPENSAKSKFFLFETLFRDYLEASQNAISAIVANMLLMFLYIFFSFTFWNSLGNELARNGEVVRYAPLNGGILLSLQGIGGVGLYLDVPFYVFLVSFFLNLIFVLMLIRNKDTKQ